MRRLGFVSLSVTVACASRPWTPAVSVAYWSQETSGTKLTALPTTEQAAKRWQLDPSSPWAPYNKVTLLAAMDKLHSSAPMVELPDISSLDVMDKVRIAAQVMAQVGLPPNTMIVVDLRGAASVVFGAALSNLSPQPVSLVLTFNNWPGDDQIVPADETLAALAIAVPTPAPVSASFVTPVFLMDAWRLAFREDEPEEGAFDNRYVVMPGDMPNVQKLREQVITRVLYVVEDLDETELEEDDLHPIFGDYQAAGIAVHMVDLAWLARARPDWAGALAPRSLWVARRMTVLDDPAFYVRARGGFGGISGFHVITTGRGFHRFSPGGGFGGGGFGGGGFGGG